MKLVKSSEKGNLIVISGPSGSGKDTIVNEVLKKNKNVWLSVSMTSRKKRNGEEEGKSYYFVSKKEFKENIKNDNLLEYAVYNDNYYGTLKEKILEKINSGIDVILVIEIQGALQIKKKISEAIFIFILPPSLKELKRRLINRKTESKQKIISRFKTAYKEINEATKYNYVVINDDIDVASNKINSILISERCRVDRIEQIYLNNMEEELHELLVGDNFVNEEIKF